MKKIFILLSCIGFTMNAWSQNAAAVHNETTGKPFYRIVKTKKIEQSTPDPIADEIKYRKNKEALIINQYCKENDVKFISEEDYLSMNTKQRNEIANDKHIIVSNSPILFIQENKETFKK